MADLITIDRELLRLSKALAEAVNEYEVMARDAAEKRTSYDVAYAQALLRFRNEDGTEAVKKAMATQTCANSMTDARIAEAVTGAMKERIRALQTVISVQQSRLRNQEETESVNFQTRQTR